jgi:ABC-type transport system involved in cytochrome c biogenesis permease subunit
LYKGQLLFVLAFLLAACTWLMPRSRWLYVATSVSVLVPTLLLIGAITLRCLIRGRPPVSTLYETLLFVTAVGALLALASELFTRQRIALSAAAVLGMIGLYFASGYETLDKRDTMPQLVAVLDTNFWLATHVTAITIGYSAGVLAALLASIYLIAKVVGFRSKEPAFFHGLGKIVYGVLCFGLIFSTVGTILGGIWANESWGRFWGWDPKENGALLICLSQLVMLHARMAGLLREFGLCMAAAFGGTVIGFSWFGVNLLGVGLHSYGFTSGIHTVLWTYYGIQWGIIALAGAHWFLKRTRESAAREALEAAGRTKSGAGA